MDTVSATMLQNTFKASYPSICTANTAEAFSYPEEDPRMPRVHQTLLIPGQQVDEAERLLREGPWPGYVLPPGWENYPELQPLAVFSVVYGTSFTMYVMVCDNPRRILIRLYDQNNVLRGEETDLSSVIDQDYEIMVDGTVYELTITRAANTTLTDESRDHYNEVKAACPACQSPDIMTSTPRINPSDGRQIRVQVQCCACGAGWIDHFSFTGISQESADWRAPTQNVARCGT